MQTSAVVGHKGAHNVVPRSKGAGLIRTVQHSPGRLRMPCMAQANRDAAQGAEEVRGGEQRPSFLKLPVRLSSQDG